MRLSWSDIHIDRLKSHAKRSIVPCSCLTYSPAHSHRRTSRGVLNSRFGRLPCGHKTNQLATDKMLKQAQPSTVSAKMPGQWHTLPPHWGRISYRHVMTDGREATVWQHLLNNSRLFQLGAGQIGNGVIFVFDIRPNRLDDDNAWGATVRNAGSGLAL